MLSPLASAGFEPSAT